ncbi:MAG: Lrp/AsnC family transcriptional regulator [archaeon]
MSEIYGLDKRDIKILAELDSNARQSNNQIGRKIGLSKEVVKYRIDKLIEKGIILRFHTIINYFKLGVVKFKLYLRFTNADKEKADEIAKYFCNHKKTEWVALTTGRWDLIVGFLVRNVNELDDEVQTVLNKFSKFIQEKSITTTIYLSHQKREFLKNKKKEISKIVYHTTKDEQEKADELDLGLIKIIANNARIPLVEISQKIKATPRIVQYRIKELEKKKIILAYRAHLNPRAMKRIFCKLIIYLANSPHERLSKFMNYISTIQGAVWPQRVIGEWDIEIDFELESYDKFQEIILDLKEKFPDIVKNHDFCIVSREFKLDLFPGCYPAFT